MPLGCSHTAHCVVLLNELLLTVQFSEPTVLNEAKPKLPRFETVELEIVKVPVASVRLPAEVELAMVTRLMLPLLAPTALTAETPPGVAKMRTSSSLFPELNEIGPVSTGVALLEKPRSVWLVPRLKGVL